MENKHSSEINFSQLNNGKLQGSQLRNSCVCCACGEMESNTVQLHRGETLNDLVCLACLQDDNPQSAEDLVAGEGTILLRLKMKTTHLATIG
jgi:hypothetical protein